MPIPMIPWALAAWVLAAPGPWPPVPAVPGAPDPAPALEGPGPETVLLAGVDRLIERSFLASRDSLPSYCLQAEELLISAQETRPEDARLLGRLALVNGRLAEVENNAGKAERVRRMDRFCRRAIACDSTEALPYIVLGVLNLKLSSMGWIERTLARPFIGGLPPASLEEAERFLRKAVALGVLKPCCYFALGRTLEAQDRRAEATEALRVAARAIAGSQLEADYQRQARERLAKLGVAEATQPAAG